MRLANAKRPNWKALEDEDPDTLALLIRHGQQTKLLAATFLATVEAALADAKARRDTLREARRKLKATRRPARRAFHG